MKNYNIKNLFIVALMVTIIMAMSGCINIEANQKINSDGTSEIEFIYDFSALAEASSEYGEVNEDQAPDTEELREGFLENTTWKNPECIVSDDGTSVVLSGEISLMDDPHFEIAKSFPYTTYRYDATNINNIMENANLGEDQEEDDPEDPMGEMSAMAAMFGVEMTYTLEMPGEIVSTDMGDIRNDKVEIDLLELMEEEDPVYVESRELNLTGIVIAGTLVAAVLSMLVIFYVKRKKKVHKTNEDEPAEE